VGFGTGLNFLLSADYCKTHNVLLRYSGLEAFPLTADLIGRTGYGQYISRETWQAFTAGYERALGKETALSPLIRLEILPCRLQEWESDQRFDVLYFDAFAAGVQPEIWTDASLGHAAGFLKPGGVFVTYAMNGMLKKNMQSLGLGIEKLRGAAGKREMLRAIRP
jgi:tRNA U34 5-methylaminomethyl-2-thiouridine-forming methyltransferase MnmC